MIAVYVRVRTCGRCHQERPIPRWKHICDECRANPPSNSYGSGALTDRDKRLIDELAERGLTPSQVARRIGRNQRTVNYHFYRAGHKAAPEAPEVGRVTMRNGYEVRQWCRAEEQLAEELRKQGATGEAISSAIKERFGWHRARHSIDVRLLMIAARDETEPSTQSRSHR